MIKSSGKKIVSTWRGVNSICSSLSPLDGPLGSECYQKKITSTLAWVSMAPFHGNLAKIFFPISPPETAPRVDVANIISLAGECLAGSFTTHYSVLLLEMIGANQQAWLHYGSSALEFTKRLVNQIFLTVLDFDQQITIDIYHISRFK